MRTLKDIVDAVTCNGNREITEERLKQIISEVFNEVKVTDEEIETESPRHSTYILGAKWSRDLQKRN